jgi:predicted AlkP superfamily pyrophosphatase or phosphodiesterase
LKRILLITLLSFSRFCTALESEALVSEAPVSEALKPTVIVLSWDGMRHDFPDLAKFPALQRLESEGLRAKSLIPVYPSSTFPTHVSMATGVNPDEHGIVDNAFYDRDKGHYAYSGDADWLEAEPIWITAERQGVKTATFFWVSSETDWQGQGVSFRRSPFDKSVPESEKVDQIVNWLDLPNETRPHLIMSYWRGADDVAHDKGPNHADVTTRIHEQDEQLGRLLKALDDRNLWRTTTLLLVSDHGMAEVNKIIDLDAIVKESGLDLMSTGRGAVNHLFLKHKSDKPKLLSILSSVPNINVYTQDALPENFHFDYPNRTGDIILTTEAPHVFYKNTLLLKVHRLLAPLISWKVGAHGYSPENPKMHAIFLGLGRGIKPGSKLESVHQLQIAPTIAKLLGIDPPAGAKEKPINLK